MYGRFQRLGCPCPSGTWELGSGAFSLSLSGKVIVILSQSTPEVSKSTEEDIQQFQRPKSKHSTPTKKSVLFIHRPKYPKIERHITFIKHRTSYTIPSLTHHTLLCLRRPRIPLIPIGRQIRRIRIPLILDLIMHLLLNHPLFHIPSLPLPKILHPLLRVQWYFLNR